MLDSFVIRLVSAARSDGEVVGEVHVVATGLKVIVHNLDELLVVLGVGTPDTGAQTEAP